MLAVVAAMERTASDPLAPYLRDVHENLSLVNEEVAAHRDLLSTVLQANIAVISMEQTAVGVQQNSTIETLTKLSTIFLPLTFVTGFFGQNFGWLVDHIASPQAFLWYGLGAMVLPLVALLSWFRISGRRRALSMQSQAVTLPLALSGPHLPTPT
jgi:magnesium transporter